MSLGVRNIAIRFLGDTRGLERASRDGQRELDGWKGTLSRWNDRAKTASIGVIAGAAAVGKSYADLASEAEQSIGGVDAVYKNNADQVHQWAKSSAVDLGMSETAYRQSMTTIGAQLKNMGTPMDQLATDTDELITLGADLAATYGGTTSEAVEALSALLRGETDPIEQYGVTIREADIAARMAADGTDKLTGEQEKAAKKNATLALLYEQTADAQGKFAAEADTAAGKAQRSSAKWANVRTELGTRLLPLYVKAADFLGNTVLPFMDRHQTAITVTAGAIVGLAAAVLLINAGLAVYQATMVAVKAATAAWTAATWLLNAAFWANPITWVIAAIIALIAVFVIAYKKSDTFRAIMNGAFAAVKDGAAAAFGWIKKNWPLLLAILTGPFGLAVWAIRRYWGDIKGGAKAAKDWVVARGGDLVGWVKKLPGRITSATRGMWDGIKNSFRSAINWVIDGWNRLDFTIGGGEVFGKKFPSVTFGTPNLPRLATGGPADAGRPYLVGERGPELFVPSSSGTVIPNHELGGDTVVQVYIDGRALDESVTRVVTRRDRDLRRRAGAGAGAAA